MSDYIEYLRELFELFGDVQMRRMFGGHGVFYQGLMFALVVDDMLYFKADKQLAREFELKGLEPFKYTKKNKLVQLSYYQAPEESLEDPQEMKKWASKSFEVALRANAEKKS